jgi:hypothetical protein
LPNGPDVPPDSAPDTQIFAVVTVAEALNADHHLSGLATPPDGDAICWRPANWCDSIVGFGYGDIPAETRVLAA